MQPAFGRIPRRRQFPPLRYIDELRLVPQGRWISMTMMDVLFHYGRPPAERSFSAIADLRDVYGIRRVQFDDKQSTVRVEYDASRLSQDVVAGLLRRAGIDLKDKVALV